MLWPIQVEFRFALIGQMILLAERKAATSILSVREPQVFKSHGGYLK
jgi:hypothetical protein